MRICRSLVWSCLALVMTALTAGAGEKVLHIYTWSEYFDPDVIRQFEQENNCRISFDYYDSNEAMYAKLKAGARGYDIAIPSSYMSAIMNEQNMLVPLDHSLLPNRENIDPATSARTGDPTHTYSIPYTRTIGGVGYDTRYVKPEWLGSWDIFATPALARRMTMLNDIRETLGAGLKYLGYSLNTTDADELDKAADVVAGWKKNLAKFDVNEAKIGLDSGEFMAVHNYDGDIAQLLEDNPDLGFFIPREGSSLTFDEFVIVSGSKNPELAHAFINHLLNPAVAAANMRTIHYYMPNPKALALLREDSGGSHVFDIPEDAMDKCEMIRDVGADIVKYVKAWDKLKAAE